LAAGGLSLLKYPENIARMTLSPDLVLTSDCSNQWSCWNLLCLGKAGYGGQWAQEGQVSQIGRGRLCRRHGWMGLLQDSLYIGHSVLVLEGCRKVQLPRTSQKLWKKHQDGCGSRRVFYGVVRYLDWLPPAGPARPGHDVWWSKTRNDLWPWVYHWWCVWVEPLGVSESESI